MVRKTERHNESIKAVMFVCELKRLLQNKDELSSTYRYGLSHVEDLPCYTAASIRSEPVETIRTEHRDILTVLSWSTFK